MKTIENDEDEGEEDEEEEEGRGNEVKPRNKRHHI